MLNFAVMKPISLFFSMLIAIALSSCGTPKNTAQFYQMHKNRPGVTNFKLPGWLVWLGGGIAYNSVRDEDTRAALRVARKVGKLRIMASENAAVIPAEEVRAFMSNIQQNGYEQLLSVREGRSSTVNIMINDRRDKIRNMLILVNDEDGFVFLDLKTRLKYKEITELINYFLEKEEEEEAPIEEKPRA
jgi:hypothetical protein